MASDISMSIPVREAITVNVPWISGKTPCPVKDHNRDVWTALEREKGEDRIIPKDIEDLKKLASVSYLFYSSFSLIFHRHVDQSTSTLWAGWRRTSPYRRLH